MMIGDDRILVRSSSRFVKERRLRTVILWLKMLSMIRVLGPTCSDGVTRNLGALWHAPSQQSDCHLVWTSKVVKSHWSQIRRDDCKIQLWAGVWSQAAQLCVSVMQVNVASRRQSRHVEYLRRRREMVFHGLLAVVHQVMRLDPYDNSRHFTLKHQRSSNKRCLTSSDWIGCDCCFNCQHDYTVIQIRISVHVSIL